MKACALIPQGCTYLTDMSSTVWGYSHGVPVSGVGAVLLE
jgi:hypothetical protein